MQIPMDDNPKGLAAAVCVIADVLASHRKNNGDLQVDDWSCKGVEALLYLIAGELEDLHKTAQESCLDRLDNAASKTLDNAYRDYLELRSRLMKQHHIED